MNKQSVSSRASFIKSECLASAVFVAGDETVAFFDPSLPEAFIVRAAHCLEDRFEMISLALRHYRDDGGKIVARALVWREAVLQPLFCHDDHHTVGA